MLRLIHNQTISGPILVDDIDDGLPNKNVHRLGSTADPKAYARDGYANKPKQPVYIPRTKPYDPTIPGYIDLNQTEKVNLSAGKGKISKMASASGGATFPLITVVSFVMSDLTAPAVTNAQIDVPGVGDLTITGTNFLSVAPSISMVYIAGGAPVALPYATILAAGGVAAFTDTSIVIPAILILGVLAGDTVRVRADEQLSNIFAVV
jgi:hypothetical protein